MPYEIEKRRGPLARGATLRAAEHGHPARSGSGDRLSGLLDGGDHGTDTPENPLQEARGGQTHNSPLGPTPRAATPQRLPLTLNVTTAPLAATIDNSQSAEDLGQMSVKMNRFNHGGVSKEEAATVTPKYKDFTTTNAAGKTVKRYYVESADIHLTYSKMKLFIAKRYPPGSCEYNATLAHEQQHVADYNNSLGEIAEQRHSVLAASQGGLLGKPLATRSNPRDEETNYGEVVISNKTEASDWKDTFVRALSSRNDQKIKMLDTRQEYERVFRMCPNGKWKQ